MAFESSRHFARPAGTALCIVVLATAGAPGDASAAGGAALASHRAVYDLAMTEADERSGIAQIQGRLVSEFVGDTCEGYTLNMRRVLRIVTTEGTANTFDTVTTSWESGNGDDMRFGSRLYVNGKLSEPDDLEGAATLNREGGEGTVVYEKPKEIELPLPPGTVFPVEHSNTILAAARAGEVISRATVFDGGEFDKTYTAVTFIGARMEPGDAPMPADAAMAEALSGVPAWPVTVSYYADEAAVGTEQLPSYEVQVVMFDNGIATDLKLAYEGFSLSGDLADLEVFDHPPCE